MSCYNSMVVPAPADRVWNTIKNFHDMSWAEGVIETCERVGDRPGDRLGARRILNDTFHETLQAVNEIERSFSYSIDDGPGTPVARDKVDGYYGSVQVLPISATDESLVVWASRWETGSAEIAPFCNGIYMALLNALRGHFAAT
ncbi:MAG: SRPBCC family protein [Rhodothermales bacterium]